MTVYKNLNLDEERALYGISDSVVESCSFDGPADGESAFKECKNVSVKNCFFNLRYPFWHDSGLKIDSCEMTELCRAALWYSTDIEIRNAKMHGIKALRECKRVKLNNCDIISPEFGWLCHDVEISSTTATAEYFMFSSTNLRFNDFTLNGKYSFQYIKDSVFENCTFNTKDAFWHAENVYVKNCTVKGEYLAWYCKNVTFENCVISGTQPLCYCEGLKLINCEMQGADFAFEKSDVEATITSPVISIKNVRSGKIFVPSVEELILDDETAKGEIIVG